MLQSNSFSFEVAPFC